LTRRTLALSSSAALGAALALVLTGAPSALAATLPDTDTTVIATWSTGALSTVDPETGALTGLGAAPTPSTNFAGIDVASNGAGYAIGFAPVATLVPVDLTAGTYGTAIPITTTDGEPVGYCTALDMSASGVLVAACDSPDQTVGVVDATTGVFSPIATTLARVSALATNPLTGVLYAFEYGRRVLTLDPATGATALVATPDFTAYAADFDSTGVLWYSSFSQIGTVDTATWTATVLPSNVQSEALTVWSTAAAVVEPPVVVDPVVTAPAAITPAAPAVLAETGVETAPTLWAAGLLLALGASALVLRARRSA
jgi:hypothetical protein